MQDKKKLKLIKQLGIQVRKRVKKLNREVLDYELCWNSNLAGGCLMSSYMLQYVLKKQGIKSKLIRGRCRDNYHWWLVIDNNIVDITATQFGVKERVYIIPSDHVQYKPGRRQSAGFGVWPKRMWPPLHVEFFEDIGTLA